MNYLNETVKVTTRKGNVVYIGKVIKQENNIIWIVLDNEKQDQLKFFTDWDSVEIATQGDLMESYLYKNDFDFEAYGNSNEIDFQVAGYTYAITLFWDGYVWHCETMHYERNQRLEEEGEDVSKAYGNKCTRSTLKGAINYLEKWSGK